MIESTKPEGKENCIVEISPGKYQWLHETNLYRNMTFLFMIWRIYSLIWLGVAIFVLAISVSGSNWQEIFISIGTALIYVFLFILVLMTFSYFIYALIMGGRYTVLFEMDNKTVSHTQIYKQYKKGEKILTAAALAGMLTKNPAMAASSFIGSKRQSVVTKFSDVRGIKIKSKSCTVKLRSSDLMHNQVYTAPEDFDFVVNFIKKRVNTAVRFR